MSDLTTVERAFRIARSGEVRTMGELRKALHAERLTAVDMHLSGLSIQRQLKDVMAKAQA